MVEPFLTITLAFSCLTSSPRSSLTAAGLAARPRGKDLVAQHADLVGDRDFDRLPIRRLAEGDVAGRADHAALNVFSANILCQQCQLDDLRQGKVGAHALLDLVIQAGRLGHQGGQHVELHDPFADGKEHFLLALGAVKVAAFGVAVARVSQGCRAVHHVDAGLQVERVVRAERVDPDVFLGANLYPAHFIDDAHEGIEIHQRVVLDRHAEHLLDGIHRQAGAAFGHLVDLAQEVGGVDLVVIETRDNTHRSRGIESMPAVLETGSTERSIMLSVREAVELSHSWKP